MNYKYVTKWTSLLVLCMIVMASALNAQKSNVADSLLQELEKTDEDTARVRLMNELALSVFKSNQDSAFLWLEPAISLAEEINDSVGLFEVWDTKGRVFERMGKLDSAIYFLKRAEGIASMLGDKRRQARSLQFIGRTYRKQNKKRLAISSLNTSLALSTDIKDKSLQFAAVNILGTVYSSMAIYDTSEMYSLRALELQYELGNKIYQAGILRNLGNNATRANNLEKALDYFEQGIAIMEETGDKRQQAILYRMMGYSCFVFGQFPRAINYYQNALAVCDLDTDKDNVVAAWTELSEVYTSMNDFEQALSLIEKVHKVQHENGNVKEVSVYLIRKGKLLYLKDDYESALQELNTALRVLDENNVTINRIELYLYLGHSYEHLTQLDSSIYFYKKAVESSDERGYFPEKSRALKNLGNVYYQVGQIDSAVYYLESAIKTAVMAGNMEYRMAASKILYEIYKGRDNTHLALYYYESYRNLQDSLFNEENIKKITLLEAGYAFKQEKQELADKRKQEIREHEESQRILGIALGIALLLIAIFFWYYRLKQKANEKLSVLNKELNHQKKVIEKQKESLEELDEAKSRFFTNISHEFRTPLTIISGMIDHISTKPELWLEKGSRMIKENTISLLNLVNQILDLRKLESGALELNIIQGDVVQYLRYITESHLNFAADKGIKLHFQNVESAIQMDYDPDKLLRIVTNLLANAVKFTPDGGDIYFHVSQQNQRGVPFLEIRIEDTGIGISEERLAKIFDLFYQADDSRTRRAEGTGIGLAFTQELVKLMNGDINVTSELGKGTSFQVVLPITTLSEIRDAQFKTQTSLPQVAPVATEALEFHRDDSKISPGDLPHLLIVEDNQDVAQFLIASLESDYQLSVASDGQEGIDVAIEQIPDIVVSDVMMPVKDGFELCETLKLDERTSHIPIILLTAKADLDSKMIGLENGADAYLTKPVEQKELHIRLKKLLALRKRLQERYGSLDFNLTRKDREPNLEDAFLMKARDIVEKHMADPDFGIALLANTLYLSESQLYRKIKALTDKSPVPFIRSVRLLNGKKLLQETKLNVSEVAYEVGFTDPAYFSKAFSKEFGASPREMRKS